MEVKVSTFEELIELLETRTLTSKQRHEIVRLTLKVILLKDYTQWELIQELKTMRNKYGSQQERPIFLGVDLDNA
ncbi:hypothetical protein OAB01_04085 [Bacteroidia bacterium]|nr:hypothetical protein [Bacteroidia bacterium]